MVNTAAKPLLLREGLYYTGIQDPDLRVFDIIMRTEFGTTYNSYALIGAEKTVLMETVKASFADEWMNLIRQAVDPAGVAYLIVSHTEPDHAGSIERLLDINPGLTIVATSCALGYLKHILNRDFRSLAVKEGTTLPLGGKTLRFFPLPNLHWPDTMFTYIEEDRALLTCDSFGSHYALPEALRSKVTDEEGYRRATKYYFDNILGPFKRPYMVKALDKAASLEIDLILTGHGPVLDSHLDQIMSWYRDWTAAPVTDGRKRVAIPYVSAYGYTRELAGEVARGIKAAGDTAVELFDLVTDEPMKASAAIDEADGVLFGTPTILGEALAPIWDMASRLYPPIHAGKLASAFGSYGWSGEGVPHIIERLKQVRMKVLDGLRVRFKPSAADRQDAFNFGYNFGCVLFDKENDRLSERQSGGPALVKCLVCGEVFPESTPRCPVCGVGPEQFVRFERENVRYSNDTDERFLIIGAGVAGISAAKAIRARNKTASIVLINGEDALPYNRPMLTKNLFGQLTAEQFPIADGRWYEENNVTLISGQRAAALDPVGKTVKLESGARLMYDKCVLALGAVSAKPPIPGADLPNIFTIRSLEDARRIESAGRKAKRAVVIGGGVLGLETAWDLKQFKLDVSIVESMPRLLDRKISNDAGDMLASAILAAGAGLHMGAQVKDISADGDIMVVRLADGTELPADIVILSTGIRANTAVAEAAGLAVSRGITVDDHMRTSASDVYACGDAAIFDGMRYGLWAEAGAMGDTAGANAAGDNVVYERQSAPVTISAFGTSLFTVGDTSADPGKLYRTASFRDPQKNSVATYHFLNNRLVGATLLGDVSSTADILGKVEAHAQYKELFPT